MIDKLFTYTECNELDQLNIVYENVQLICSIGKHAPDTKFDWICIDYDCGFIFLSRDDRKWQYPLTLQVGKLIQEPTQ